MPDVLFRMTIEKGDTVEDVIELETGVDEDYIDYPEGEAILFYWAIQELEKKYGIKTSIQLHRISREAEIEDDDFE